MDGETCMRVREFTAAFTGQLSVVEGIHVPRLRVEQGHKYRLEIADSGQGRLMDLTLTDQDNTTGKGPLDAGAVSHG
jgi:hypothetical protein